MTAPKIEVRNLKHAAFASEETHCFEASVYVDGKRFCTASNDGHGGPDMYTPVKPNQTSTELHKQIEEIGAQLPIYTVKTYRGNYYGHRVDVHGSSKFVDGQDNPLSCGAVAWAETKAPVHVHNHDENLTTCLE